MTIVTELKDAGAGRQSSGGRPRLAEAHLGRETIGGLERRGTRRGEARRGTLTPEANQATGTEQRGRGGGRGESREEALCVTQGRGGVRSVTLRYSGDGGS